MSTRVGIEVSLAAAEAVGLADVDVVAAYPITPQTHIVEHLAEMVAEGALDAEYVAVESEHSAISACVGAAAAGARTFTATASQGLALMHEVLFLASSMRFPIVMAIANRALSAPINIWADHSDVMPQRDTGWAQLFAENGQEVFDLIIQAFRLAEDHRVLLPVMVNMDGFSLSHVIEPVDIMGEEDVRRFLPPFQPGRMLDPREPRTMGAFGFPNVYTEVKMAQERALYEAEGVLREIWSEFESAFGRKYRAVETYCSEDAKIVLVTMGAVSETARSAVSEMRQEGLEAGLVSLRLWRPFPGEEFVQALEGVERVVVLDRMLSPGSVSGPVGMEVRSALYHVPKRPVVVNYVAGLGGRELSRKSFKAMVSKALSHDTHKNGEVLFDGRTS